MLSREKVFDENFLISMHTRPFPPKQLELIDLTTMLSDVTLNV